MTTARPGGARAALLMLADGRFPAGGYAHSGGLEPAIADGHVRTVDDLESFVAGRLRTAGLVAAAFAAATCRTVVHPGPEVAERLHDLDQELDARMPSPAQRRTSRALGRQLVRAATAIAPGVLLEPLGRNPHHSIALGAVHAAVGLGPREAALACLHEAAAGPVAAAVRLLSIDPFDAHGVLHRAGPLMDELAARAVDSSDGLGDLPCATAPLLDLHAERHRTRRTRLFAS